MHTSISLCASITFSFFSVSEFLSTSHFTFALYHSVRLICFTHSHSLAFSSLFLPGSLITMARTLLLIALCLLPALVIAGRPTRNPFVVQGRVYCDTCRAGFETPATTYITGAKVKVECKERKSAQVVYSKSGKTDSTGTYKIYVTEDHEDQYCDAILVSSPQNDCKTLAPGRDRARVILTSNNGIASDNRYANSIGFMKTEAMSGCADILRLYQEDED